jgi:hypothetical protein
MINCTKPDDVQVRHHSSNSACKHPKKNTAVARIKPRNVPNSRYRFCGSRPVLAATYYRGDR